MITLYSINVHLWVVIMQRGHETKLSMHKNYSNNEVEFCSREKTEIFVYYSSEIDIIDESTFERDRREEAVKIDLVDCFSLSISDI